MGQKKNMWERKSIEEELKNLCVVRNIEFVSILKYACKKKPRHLRNAIMETKSLNLYKHEKH